MKDKLHKVLRKRSSDETNDEDTQKKVPRITNDTVAAHREEVLSSARKYIYPLQHSKHRIVLISTAIFILAIVALFTYTTVALYRTQSSSTFLYRITQILPFPVARAGGQFVAYENYLFELRHYQHYYETQLDIDFTDEKDAQQLEQFKQRALDKVITDAYVKQLAARHGVSVSDQEVEDQITIVRNQNRLGSSERVFEDVIRDYWGWSVDDFRRSLRQQLLAQKVVAKLDTDTSERAAAAMRELEDGADFADVAKKYSDDVATKDNGGEFNFELDKTSREISAQSAEALFALEEGEYTEVVNTGYSLQILKKLEQNGDKVRAAHILFNFKPIEDYVNDLKEEQNYTVYIKLPEAATPEASASPQTSEQ